MGVWILILDFLNNCTEKFLELTKLALVVYFYIVLYSKSRESEKGENGLKHLKT